MSSEQDAHALISDHLSPEEMREARVRVPGRAQAMEAGNRALSTLKAIRIEQRMRAATGGMFADDVLAQLERTLKADVRLWLELTSCPHCAQHVGA